jgi:flagellin-like hook-associated protein FlgL
MFQQVATYLSVRGGTGSIFTTKEVSMAGANAIHVRAGAIFGATSSVKVFVQVSNELENWLYLPHSGTPSPSTPASPIMTFTTTDEQQASVTTAGRGGCRRWPPTRTSIRGNQIANSTTFNGVALLNPTSTVTLQIGPGTTAGVDTLNVTMTNVTASTLSVSTLNIGSSGDPSAAIVALDTALNTVTSARGSFGASQNRLNSAISALQVRSENLSAANSRILDVDVAVETARLTKFSILQQSALGVLAQANTQPSIALSLLQ